MQIWLVLPLKSQGQLAGFVIDEAHCVRYVLCFVDNLLLFNFIDIYKYLKFWKLNFSIDHTFLEQLCPICISCLTDL